MEARLQRRVQRYGWDKAAPCYEQSWHRQLAPAQTRLLALAALRPGERVIDVACGTGLVTFAAAAAVGPEGTVVGTDISDAMVAHARTRATGITHDLRFERILARVGWPLQRLGEPKKIGVTMAVAGILPADAGTFQKLRPSNYRSECTPLCKAA